MKSVLIIAEAGVNHNGRLDLALKLVDKAKEAGADIVKFQTGKPEAIISKYAPKAQYQKLTTNPNESQLNMIRKITLSYNDFRIIKSYCDKCGIKFLSTPFDLESIDFLQSLDCDIWKIPSGEITNLPYLERIARTKKPVIISTGMCTLEEIKQAYNIFKDNEVTLLHCTTEYPAPYEDINLNAMKTMKNTFGCEVGYSDHSKGIEVPIAAVALGAKVIEKHFTLNKNLEGPDHKASLEPQELKLMIESIRNIEVALGDGIKIPKASEIKNINIARKSIVALRNIKKGEIFTEDNITTKRPGTGISPMQWYSVLGKPAERDFLEDELIEI